MMLRMKLGWSVAMALSTMALPVLGPAFGRAGLWIEIVIIGILGAIGGICWAFVWSGCLTVYDVAAIVNVIGNG